MKKEKQEVSTKEATNQETPQEQKNILLGTISYTNDEDYENFLAKLDVNQAMFVLIASANYAQAKGLYNLDESELVAKAIKKIKKSSAQSAPAKTEEVKSEETNS
jgi:hypothetical protein